MSETVKMMKAADVHPDQVAEFERHGWKIVDPLTGLPEDGPDDDQDAAGTDVKPAKPRARAGK